jgi:hypothetical protein
MRPPSSNEFKRGIQEYERREKRDAMYKVATFLVSHFWGIPSDMADGLGALLLTWNQAFYRYGVFDFDKLERCIRRNLPSLKAFRERDISSFSRRDAGNIKHVFIEFLGALEIEVAGTGRPRRSPVATAKALHVLAPSFFPLWDDRIARAYSHDYHGTPAETYVSFCSAIKTVAAKVSEYEGLPDKPTLKLIDEYNYAKYTKGWV